MPNRESTGDSFHSAMLLYQQFGAVVDPLGIFLPLVHAQIAWWLHPQPFFAQAASFVDEWAAISAHAVRRAVGVESADPVRPQPDDSRFAEPVWTDDAIWDVVKEVYLLWTRRTQDMLYATPGLSSKECRRAAFWWRKYLNAVAPNNFLCTNPVAMRKAIESQGFTILHGAQNFGNDWIAGDIRMTSPADFTVGKNLALTEGAVVARNRLLELIRYTPTQGRVREVPVVIITPWINKYYILDLVPQKSMVKFLLDQGFDVFITSWKNPDASMSTMSFDDYLLDGVEFAVQSARSLAVVPNVSAVGYCIGGTALAIYMAWATHTYPANAQPVAAWTLLTTLTDFSCPGDIEVFIDEGSVRYLCETMQRKGFLDGKEMASAFRLLRSNSLIWHYYVHGYLYGEQPGPFDVLYWNMDTTRMPAAMHSWYLRELYLHNRLIVPDALTVAGSPIALDRIKAPLYAVGAEDDHIAPWRQTFRIVNFARGPKRYVRSSSGHILGITNPVVSPPKRRYVAGDAHRRDSPEKWLARNGDTAGSWWPDWVHWLGARSGELKTAPEQLGPVIYGDAPGTYVHER